MFGTRLNLLYLRGVINVSNISELFNFGISGNIVVNATIKCCTNRNLFTRRWARRWKAQKHLVSSLHVNLTLCLHLHGPFNSQNCMVNLMNTFPSISLSDSKNLTFAFFCSSLIPPTKRFYELSHEEISLYNNMIQVYPKFWQ